MSTIKNFFFGKPEPTPEEKVKAWKNKLRTECRQLDRSITRIEREEMKVKREIKIAAKEGDQQSVRILAKEIVRSKKAKERMHTSKAMMNSLSLQLQQQLTNFKINGTIKASTEMIALLNDSMNIPEISNVMRTLSTEMYKSELLDEMIEETFDNDDVDEEADEEVDKVLSELAIETSEMLSKTPILKEKTLEDEFYLNEGLKENDLNG